MEALGAAAAAFQLAQTGTQIVEILSKIHNAPTWVKDRQTQVQGLINMAKLISNNQSLRTALLQSLLNGCLKDATRLNNLLIGLSAKEEDGKIVRYWKSIVTVSKENKILGIFARLEEDKSALALCIANINSEVLNGIDTGIVALGDSLAAVVNELPAVRQTAQDVTTLITQILQLRELTTGLRLELSSISEKVSTLRNHASTSSGLDKSEASGPLQTSAVHASLPALLHALEHLSMQDDKDGSIKNSSIANSEEVMKHGQCVITVDDLYTKDEARLCLASLSPTDQKILRNRLRTKYDLACQWFLALPAFYTWENGDYSDLLYITANAGCGKTTMAAHVLDALEKSATAVDKETCRLLYFFFQKSNVEGEGTAAAALRTIINQLVYQMPSLYYTIRRQYDILATRGTVIWSWDSLSIVFVDMMSQIKDRSASKTYLVLDGLDECLSDTRRDLVVFLRSILEENTTQASSRQVSAFKVFITGRPDNDIFDIIPPSKHAQITHSQTTGDISTLIKTGVAELGLRRRLGPDVQIAIKHFLETNARGMFLWVVLVLQELERRDERLTDAVIAARLSALPRTLTATYEGIISSTPLARRDDLWRILRIMLVSRRTMTITELEAALCAELGISNWHDFAGDVNALCSSLITFEGDKVLFVHQSVRDFLQAFVSRGLIDQLGGINCNLRHAEAQMACNCLEYLVKSGLLSEVNAIYSTKFKPHRTQHRMIVAASEKWPFLEYATEYWGSHLGRLEDPDVHITDLALGLLRSQLNRDMLIRLYYWMKHHSAAAPRDTSKLHICAYFNLKWFTAEYIQRQEDINSVADCGDTPLVWGSEMGATQSVQLLLEAGANPNLIEYDGWSPLHWAATNGHVEICKLLLKHGARIDARDGSEATPSDWAAARGQYAAFAAIEAFRSVTSPTGSKDPPFPNEGPIKPLWLANGRIIKSGPLNPREWK